MILNGLLLVPIIIAFDNADSALLGTDLELVGNLKPQSADQKVSVEITKPDGNVSIPLKSKLRIWAFSNNQLV